MSERYCGMRVVKVSSVGATGLLALAASLWALGACDFGEHEVVAGEGTPVAVATVSAETPATAEPAAPVTMVSATIREAVPDVILENVTYGDAEKVYRRGDYVEAAGLFEAYTLRKPENVWGHYMLGISAWKAGEHGRAEEALLRVVELEPSHSKGLVNLARVLLEQNRPQAALDHAEQAVVVAPESVDAWRVLGNVRSALGDAEEAVESYKRAIALLDTDAWSMNNLGLALIRAGRYEEALPALARAVELKPETATFQNNLGVALERSGYLSQARDAYRAAAEGGHELAGVSLSRVEERLSSGGGSAQVDLGELSGVFRDEIETWKLATGPHC